MKNAKENAEVIIAAVTEMKERREAGVAALTIVNDAEATSVAILGEGSDLVLMLAKVMVRDENFKQLVETALHSAGVLEMLEAIQEDDGTPCDCPNCVANRKTKAKNLNVN